MYSAELLAVGKCPLTIQSVLHAQQPDFTFLAEPVENPKQLGLVNSLACDFSTVVHVISGWLDRHRLEQRRLRVILFCSQEIHVRKNTIYREQQKPVVDSVDPPRIAISQSPHNVPEISDHVYRL